VLPRIVRVAGDEDHLPSGRQQAEQQVGEQEVAQVVDREGRLQAVDGARRLADLLHARIADQRVQGRQARGLEPGRERAHRGERGQVQRERSRALPDAPGRLLGARGISAGERDTPAPRTGELAGALQAQP
jgi:hypothetical protein